MKVKINGKYSLFFNDIALNRKFDSIASTFSISVRFNPDNDFHKNLVKPLSFHTIEIYNDNSVLIFTGTILSQSFTSDKNINLVALGGYSKPGVLEDCTLPFKNYPLENNNKNLIDIAEDLCSVYSIKTIFDDNAISESSRVYSKSVAEPTESIKSYLNKLTSQRNIVLGHTADGKVRFSKPDFKSKPVFLFNKENTLSMSCSINGQGMHDVIGVIRQPSVSNAGVQTYDVATNPLFFQFRNTVKVLSNGEDTDTSKAADNELASELKNISVSISINELVELNPGDIVEVQNKEVYLYNKNRFVVSEINYTISNGKRQSNLKLVLPETFTSEQPKNIFDD
jgi:prophage tail gpP-like protein